MRRSLSVGSIPLDVDKSSDHTIISSKNLQSYIQSSNIDIKQTLRTWLLADVEHKKKPEKILPLESFNHIARYDIKYYIIII